MSDEEELAAIMLDIKTRPTISPWPAAGKALGVSRKATYAAVKSGDLPSIRIGRAIRIPTAPLRRQLGIDAS
jgi:excisionase family DNA binding protein